MRMKILWIVRLLAGSALLLSFVLGLWLSFPRQSPGPQTARIVSTLLPQELPDEHQTTTVQDTLIPTLVPTPDAECLEWAEHLEAANERCQRLLDARVEELQRYEQSQAATAQTQPLPTRDPRPGPTLPSLASLNRVYEIELEERFDDRELSGSSSAWHLAAVDDGNFARYGRVVLAAFPPRKERPARFQLIFKGRHERLVHPERYTGMWYAPEPIGIIAIITVTNVLVGTEGPSAQVAFSTSWGRSGTFDLASHAWTLSPAVPTPIPPTGILESTVGPMSDYFITQNQWQDYIDGKLVHVYAGDNVIEGLPEDYGYIMITVEGEPSGIPDGWLPMPKPMGAVRITAAEGTRLTLAPINGGESFYYEVRTGAFTTLSGALFPTATLAPSPIPKPIIPLQPNATPGPDVTSSAVPDAQAQP